MASAGGEQPIIIKKKKVAGHGHHGGAWKVAYADFVTAMMAFFLLLWLLGSTSKEDRQQIQAYFRDPAGSIVGQGGGLDAPGMGNTGPGGANQGMINWDNPLTQPQTSQDPLAQSGAEPTPPERPPEPPTASEGKPDLDKASDEEVAREQAQREQKSLDALQQDLQKELARDDSAFVKLRDQILIDQTALGLRIQIVDKANRPMFESGSKELEIYAEEVLYRLATILNKVVNKLSVNGHTDAVPYGPGSDYTNWELSADRANSARRALIDGDYPENKILTVQGMGPSVPRLPDKPEDPSNRRIVILVLKKEIEDALKGNTLVTRTQEEIINDESATSVSPGAPTP
jgi:chemotaxis protein MotB